VEYIFENCCLWLRESVTQMMGKQEWTTWSGLQNRNNIEDRYKSGNRRVAIILKRRDNFSEGKSHDGRKQDIF